MPSFWKRRSLAVGYWHYWLNGVNQHSLHAPFIYQFYQQVIRDATPPPEFEDIEQYRKNLKTSTQKISVKPIGATSVVNNAEIRSVSDIARNSLSSPKFGRLLYRLVQFQQPRVILELGTSLGTTTLYLSADAQNKVFTLEGCPETAELAKQAFQSLSRENIELREGNIDTTLPDLLNQIETVDLVYIDANHRKEPTLRYFQQLLPKTHAGSILVFDDIYWSFEMMEAWKIIRNHPQVTLSIDLFDAGIIFFRPLATRQHYTLMF